MTGVMASFMVSHGSRRIWFSRSGSYNDGKVPIATYWNSLCVINCELLIEEKF
jgi:hypothetical protein